MTRMGQVMTGRKAEGRQGRDGTFCLSCEARIYYGEPKPSTVWAKRLRLSEEQIDLLLVAFSEFMEHGGGDPIDALDWVRPNALGLIDQNYPQFSGTSIREGDGRLAEPFPLPRSRA